MKLKPLHKKKLIEKIRNAGEITPSDLLEPYLNLENIEEIYTINVSVLIKLLELIVKLEEDLPTYINSFLSAINMKLD